MILAHPDLSAPVNYAWSLDFVSIASAVLAVALYLSGLYATGVRAVSRRRAACFVLGIAVALLASISPLHTAAEIRFSGHMVQHLLYFLVAAPLIVAGRPALVVALALPARWRRVGWQAGRTRGGALILRLLRHPLAILLTYTAVLWTWHLPGPYEASLRDDTVHALEHASFLGVALAFWAGVVRTGPRRRIAHVPSMALVLGTMLQGTWLAAILTFGGLAYPLYGVRARLVGIDPLADQQAAGAIRWIPSAIAYFAVFAVLFVAWFRELDSRHARTPGPVVAP